MERDREFIASKYYGNEDEIDLRQLFETLRDRKLTIIAIFLSFLFIGAVFAYFSTPIYQTSATIQIKSEGKASQPSDMMLEAFGFVGAGDIKTEIEIIKSRALAMEALHDVPFGVRYFVKNGLRRTELYRESPFIVSEQKILDEGLYGKVFSFEVTGPDTFRLALAPTLAARLGVEKALAYEGEHSFGETITTDFFVLKIDKRGEFESKEYTFSFSNPRMVYENIISKNLNVAQVDKEAAVVQLTYSDNVPGRAQEFVNALAQNYISQSIELKTEQASRTLEFIERQLETVQKNLESSEAKLESFKQTNNTMDISAETKAAIEKMSVFDQQLAQIEIEEDQAERLNTLIRKGDFSALSLGALGISDPLIANLLQALGEAERKKKAMLVELTELHPDVVQVTGQIERLKHDIVANLASLRQSIAERKRSIEKVIARNESLFKRLPESERTYANLQRSYLVSEKIYSYLLEKQSEASIAKASTVSSNRILDSALMPMKPIKPKKALILAVSGVLGLILGVLVAFVRDYLDDTIKEWEDVTKETSIPVIGSIPFIKEGIDTRHLVTEDPKSVYAESFRAIRTNLQFMAIYASRKVILITSTLSGEGKTTISSNIGAVLAMNDKKTVILNLELRLPTLHDVFGLPNTVGMSNYLSGHAELDGIIQHTNVENLDIISSGPVPPNPSELILTVRMKEAIAQLKERYDYVILYTPPVGLVTDALILMNEADISLFVIRANYARRGVAKRFDRTVKSHDIKNVGIVLNALPIKKGGYGYGYGYGYGGYYGEGGEKKPLWARWFKR